MSCSTSPQSTAHVAPTSTPPAQRSSRSSARSRAKSQSSPPASPTTTQLLRLANQAYEERKFRRVCQLMDESLQLQSNHIPSLLLLAAALRKQRLFEEAKKIGLRVLRQPRLTAIERIKAKLCLGYCRLEHYRDQGYDSDFREAEDWFMQAARENNVQAYCGLVFLYCLRVEAERKYWRSKHGRKCLGVSNDRQLEEGFQHAASIAILRAQQIDRRAPKVLEALRVFRRTFGIR